MLGVNLPLIFSNYTVKIFENYFSNSQGHCEQESIDRMSKPIKERFYECLNMGNGATVRMHCFFGVILPLIFSKTIQ